MLGIRIDFAKLGRISSIPGVCRHHDRQEWVIRTTSGGILNVRRNDIVVRIGGRIAILPLSKVLG